MKRKRQIASIGLYGVSIVAALFGLIYLLSPTIMPYHETFLGVTHEELDPKTAALFLALLRVAGSCFLAIAASIALLVRGLFSKGDAWSWWILLVLCLVCLVPLLFVSLGIGTYTPWWVVAILIVLVIVAAGITIPRRRGK